MGVELRNRFAPGQELRWRTRMNVEQRIGSDEQEPRRQEWSTILLGRVIAVESDGSAHITVVGVPEFPYAEQTETALQAQKQVAYAWIDTVGDMRQFSVPNPLLQFALPEGAVEVGDSWERQLSITLPPTGQTEFVSYQYTYRGMKDIDGIECAHVDIVSPQNAWEITVPGAPEGALVTVETKGDFYFDIRAGAMLRLELETQTAPSVGTETVTTLTRASQELLIRT